MKNEDRKQLVDRDAVIEAARAYWFEAGHDTNEHRASWEIMTDFAIQFAQTQKAAQPAESEFCECGHSQVSHWLPKSACEGFGQCDCPQYRPAAAPADRSEADVRDSDLTTAIAYQSGYDAARLDVAKELRDKHQGDCTMVRYGQCWMCEYIEKLEA